MKEFKDKHGHVIAKDCRVRQTDGYDTRGGTLTHNNNRPGTVVSLGRTRVNVQFDGRGYFRNNEVTSQPKIDAVNPEFLEVLGEDGEPLGPLPSPREKALQEVREGKVPQLLQEHTLQRRVAQRLALGTEILTSEEAYWEILTDRAKEKYLDLADEIIDMVKEFAARRTS